jgi:copper chaperone
MGEERTMKKTVLIEGMHCSNCAAKMTGVLKKLPGVNAAIVTNGVAELDINEDVNIEDINAAIERAGYTPIDAE